jgi:uncharacterized protein
VLVGDNTDAPWHPLEPVRQELEAILGGDFELECTEDYDRFHSLNHRETPLCISYTDCWKKTLTPEQSEGVIRFVEDGGGLLAIHNGISIAGLPELKELVGGRFITHPPYQTLQYYGTASDHPLLDGVGDFTLEEEPYFFELEHSAACQVIMEYAFEGSRYPAAWAYERGQGHVVYLQPGHHAPSFRPTSYRRLILNSARWAIQR